ncbi:hypothetical protein SeMB42_g07492 [Synchytrium endobioticum]|uniref:Uncharacterized protein n=1 Tax=Synchytrium endobioticum TaxID=286115 RepID=A0A507D5J4_9FUNG|nr:hypothetical protein SeMB42_g07492 [Synchytrium endobioticum]TPX46550.1 hypothetical protein SeLEV6574_g03178 [Synchytrium endobioticum]
MARIKRTPVRAACGQRPTSSPGKPPGRVSSSAPVSGFLAFGASENPVGNSSVALEAHAWPSHTVALENTISADAVASWYLDLLRGMFDDKRTVGGALGDECCQRVERRLRILSPTNPNEWVQRITSMVSAAEAEEHGDTVRCQALQMMADLLLKNFETTGLNDRDGQGAQEAFDATPMLLAHNADINARDGSGGNTSLHIAAQSANIEIAKKLVEAKADKTIQNKNGKTAFDLLPLRSQKTKKWSFLKPETGEVVVSIKSNLRTRATLSADARRDQSRLAQQGGQLPLGRDHNLLLDDTNVRRSRRIKTRSSHSDDREEVQEQDVETEPDYNESEKCKRNETEPASPRPKRLKYSSSTSAPILYEMSVETRGKGDPRAGTIPEAQDTDTPCNMNTKEPAPSDEGDKEVVNAGDSAGNENHKRKAIESASHHHKRPSTVATSSAPVLEETPVIITTTVVHESELKQDIKAYDDSSQTTHIRKNGICETESLLPPTLERPKIGIARSGATQTAAPAARVSPQRTKTTVVARSNKLPTGPPKLKWTTPPLPLPLPLPPPPPPPPERQPRREQECRLFVEGIQRDTNAEDFKQKLFDDAEKLQYKGKLQVDGQQLMVFKARKHLGV